MNGNILIAFIAMILAAFSFLIAAVPHKTPEGWAFQNLGLMFAAIAAAALVWPHIGR